MPRSSLRTSLVTLACVVLVVQIGSAQGECTACGVSETDPFELGHSLLNPYTLGLPVGAEAPALEGHDFDAGPTLLAAVNGHCNSEYLQLLQLWSHIPELRVVVAFTGMTASTVASAMDGLGDAARVIRDPEAIPVCATYRVGRMASSVTFLIDTDGTIVYRRRGFPNYAALDLDRMVREFAATEALPAYVLQQHVLWYGDMVPWPSFDLYDRSGAPIALGASRPLLLLTGADAGLGAAVHADLTPLIAEYPEVRFVCLLAYKTSDVVASIWEFGRMIGLESVHPEWYALSLDEFLAKSDLPGRAARLAESARRVGEAGWEVAYDENNKLIAHWLLYATPGVMLLDEHGTVVFPFTLYPVHTDPETGLAVSEEGAVEELARILDGMLGR